MEIHHRPKPGDTVVLKEIPRGLVDCLPFKDQRAIADILGKPVRLCEYDDDGRAVLEFSGRDGEVHFVFVRPDSISIA